MWCITRDTEFAHLIGVESHTSADGSDKDGPSEGGANAGRRSVKVPSPAGLTIANSSQGCLVVRVVRGNGGDRAGIKVGDLLLAVNGTEVRDHAIAIECIERRCRVGDCEVDVKPSSRGFLSPILSPIDVIPINIATGLPSALRTLTSLIQRGGSARRRYSRHSVGPAEAQADVNEVLPMQPTPLHPHAMLRPATALAPMVGAQ